MISLEKRCIIDPRKNIDINLYNHITIYDAQGHKPCISVVDQTSSQASWQVE
jgi:hypothetical protein